MDYWVVFEKADDGSYSAYVPDLPGCVSTGDTVEEAKDMIAQAIEAHIRSLRDHQEPAPAAKAMVVHAA